MDKVLPANIEAERATLGSVLLNREAIIAIASWLMPDDFYVEQHTWIYESMLACYNARIPPDIRTVSDDLRRRERLDSIGGIPMLASLVDTVPTSYHIEYYARIVQRTALLRRLIGAGGKIAALGYDEQDDLEATLDKAEQTLFEVSQRRSTQDFVHIGQVIDSYYEQINFLQEHRGEVVGVPTGFRDLDEITGGFQRSDLIILAARPSVGKTSCAMSIAYNVALNQGTVAVFSLEMSREQLVQRLLAMETKIDTHKLRTGHVREAELAALMEAMGRLAATPIYIEDTPGQSISEVRSKARRLQSQIGVDLVIIDYLQLMQGGRRGDNRVQEVSEISRGLKGLARELNVPVIALSQLSRAVEGRQSHVPMLSDLRESGCLAGETEIFLPDQGNYRRIDQLIGQSGFRVLALNTDTWKLELRPVLHAFSTGHKPVYLMKTRLGRTLRATANHKFLTIEGWKRLDELAIKTRVALPSRLSGLPQWTMPDTQALAESDVYWDAIVSIESQGEADVYDLTVEGLHNFVANGITVHNSIEQDADIVMFIYREELYDPNSEKKGIAELHIAKHRNGPIGVVPMRFDAATTRFYDLIYRTPSGY